MGVEIKMGALHTESTQPFIVQRYHREAGPFIVADESLTVDDRPVSNH